MPNQNINWLFTSLYFALLVPENTGAIAGLTEEAISETPIAISRRKNAKKVNLEEILNNCNKGKAILSYYRVNGHLDRPTRNKLACNVMHNRLALRACQ